MHKVILAADLHIRLETLDISRKVLARLNLYAAKYNCPVFLLGDIFHTKAVIRSECLNLVLEFFSRPDWNVYMLVGNHDFENKECEGHALESLKYLKNVIVYDKPTNVADTVHVIPYCDNDTFKKVTKNVKTPYIFCHHGISGFMMNNYKEDTDGTDIKHFKGFRKVFCGHYHQPAEKENVVYVGSPYQQNFGEAGQFKRFILLDLQTGEYKSLFINDLPQYYIMNCTAKWLLSPDREKVDTKFKEDDHLRVDIKCNKSEYKKFTKQIVMDQLGVNCNLKLNHIPIETETNITIQDSLRYDQMFTQWVDLQKTDLEKDKIKHMGLELLNANI